METKISLKPVIKSSFIPEKNSYGIYHDSLRMSLQIQIGDVIGNISLSYDVNYDDPNRNRAVSFHIYGFNEIKQVINIDVIDIVDKYKESIPKFLEDIKLQTSKHCENVWDSSWVHVFIDLAKKLQITGLSCTITSRENFIANPYVKNDVSLSMTYRGQTTSVSRYEYKRTVKYVLPVNYPFGILRDCQYTKPENLIKSFVTKVNDYWQKKDYENKKEEKRQELIAKTVDNYKSLFGECAHEETSHRSEYGSRHTPYYKKDSYYIPLKNKTIGDKILKRRVKISKDSNGFSFGSFNYLSESDVIKMINVLNGD